MADQYWWVNQSRTYEEERDLGLIWAPLRRVDGQRASHWDSLTRVEPGDIILHYGNTHLRGVSRALSRAVDTPRPFADESWGQEGRSVNVAFEELAEPVHRDAIPLALREVQSYKNSPFHPGGLVNQGYLFDLEPATGAAIVDLIERTVARAPVSSGKPLELDPQTMQTVRVTEWREPTYDPSVIHTRDSVDDLTSDRERVVTYEEFRLQSKFGLWLQDQGTPPKQLQIPIGGSMIQPDFYVPDRDWIVEAKKSSARPYVRLAIGQVLDYIHTAKKHGIDATPVILVPRRPDEDLVSLLDTLGIQFAVPSGAGFDLVLPGGPN